MKNTIKNIFGALALSFISIAFTSCYNAIEPIDNKVNSLDINNEEKLDISKVVVEMHEGHSHAPENSRTIIGDIMWSTKFNSGYFHGNPWDSTLEFPLKREQVFTYTLDSDGNFRKEGDSNLEMFNILSATPKDKYINGVMNALIVKLYDSNGNRVDQALKGSKMKNRVQVFYQVVDVKSSFDKYTLPKEYNKTDICYYWYYDRMPTEREGQMEDSGAYIDDEAVGFRGVIQSLEARTQFKLRMSVTILPEGMTKGKQMHNSISPSKEQSKHVVFQFDIPIRVITEYPNFAEMPESMVMKEFNLKEGQDWPDEAWNRYDEIVAELKNNYYSQIQEVFPDYTVERIKELIRERDRLGGESSQFYL